jgi:hypothetical protein
MTRFTAGRNMRKATVLAALAALLGAGAAALADSIQADPDAKAVLDEVARRSSQAGTFYAPCSLEASTRFISGWKDYAGRGQVWTKPPSFTRIQTERMKGKGFKGGGPATIIIDRGDEYFLCRIINTEAPLLFQRTQPTPAGSENRFQWTPGTDYIRPPLPLPGYIEGLIPVAEHPDTLRGRRVEVLEIRAPAGRGGVAGDHFNWWIDAERYCLLREENLNAGKVRARTEFTDVKELGPGIFAATALSHYNGEGEKILAVSYRDIQLGKPVADTLFVPEGTVVE